MKKDIKNVVATLLLILLGSFSTSVIYAKQVEVEDFAYYQEVVDGELARLALSTPEETSSCLTSEEVDRLVAVRLDEIIAAANTLAEAEVAPVAVAKTATTVAKKVEAKPVAPVAEAQSTAAQAEAAALAAKRAKEEAARLAAEDEASRLAAEKKARLEAKAAADRAAALAAEKAAAKKASRQSQAS